MKVAIYARVSTSKQEVENQLKDLRTYCQDRGIEIFREYIDFESGAKQERVNFNQMLSDAHKRLFSVLLVWKLDRLSRSLKHLLNTLETLKSLNVDFVCYNQNFDTTTPTGKLLFHVIGSFAEFERDLIRERVKAGIAIARSKGVKLGRRKLNLDSEKIRTLRESGKSYRQIGKELGISYASVFRTLNGGKNESITYLP